MGVRRCPYCSKAQPGEEVRWSVIFKATFICVADLAIIAGALWFVKAVLLGW